ncbi:MAG TPA: BTAD domain-containing putative transcriptional regulator [Acidimicrobiales bacterium]|nr:BTAD domain-containing putative transcriptional regulator [Acidimicrobiales bacterium]
MTYVRLVALVFVVAATVGTASAATVDQQMEPGEIIGFESLIGAEMATPADGRLRGYRFAATVTAAGTTEAAKAAGANFSTLRPASGQLLVAFSLRFDLLGDDSNDAHPVRATVVVDGKRTSLDDEDFVASGERSYVTSVPAATKQVRFEMSAAGVAQSFSLTDGRRVGDQPPVLYRDATGPEVVSDVNDEATLGASSTTDGMKGSVAIAVKRARLSYFSPGEPITTPASLAEAFLILEASGDGVEPPSSSSDSGNFFQDFTAIPASALKAHLPSGAVVGARHIGSEEGLLAGFYYFAVPAELTGARITIEPGTLQATQFRGFSGKPARVSVEGAAEFAVSFGELAGAPATATTVATTTVATTTTTARPKQRAIEPIGQGRESRPIGLLLGGLVVALLLAAWVYSRWSRAVARSFSRTATLERLDTHGEKTPPAAMGPPEALFDLVGDLVSLDGPGAEDAARAAIVEELVGEDELATVIVLARDRTERLVDPSLGHPGLRLAYDEGQAMAELDARHLQRRRDAMEAEADGIEVHRPADLVVVAPGRLSPALWSRVDAFRAAGGVGVICIGGDSYPLATVDSAGLIWTGRPQSSRLVRVMTKEQMADALGGSAPPPPSVAPVERHEQEAEEPVSNAEAPAVVSVRVLGAYRISVGDAEVAAGLRAKARELLAYLIVQRDGATADAAMEALWPETDPAKGQANFHTVVANLRTTLRSAAALHEEVTVVERRGSRYRLYAGLFDVDLWHFNDALAGVTGEHEAACRQLAADSYGGEFATDEDFVWAEPTRQQLRRTAIDNLTALSALRRAGGDLDGALGAMERAIAHDPHAEELYRSVMELQITLGRRDAAARTLRLLEQRLGELDSRPQEQTRRLVHRDGDGLP